MQRESDILMSEPDESLLGMFAKFWEPGKVKTRLAASIGNEQAAAVYRQCIETLAKRFVDVANQRQLVLTPSTSRPAFEAFQENGWSLRSQSEGDLGWRMLNFFREAVAADAQRVILIGSDSPTLPRSYVEKAFERLQKVPVVLGPSEDGGYYLIGVANQRTQARVEIGTILSSLFDEMTWSTETVLQQTKSRLTSNGIPFELLPTWFDVDSISELKRMAEEVDQMDGPTEFTQLRQVIATQTGI